MTVYNKICRDCKREFQTDNSRVRLCDACKAKAKKARVAKEIQQHKKPKQQKKKKHREFIPLHEFMYLLNKYNNEHKSSLTYGQFELAVRNGEIDI